MRRFPLLVVAVLSFAPAPLAAQLAMGPEVVVSQQDCDEAAPQVAFNSLHDEYLVVWHDLCASVTPASRVYGRRLDRWGKPAGEIFEVTAATDGFEWGDMGSWSAHRP